MANLVKAFDVGLPVTALGLGTVFTILILLWGVLELFRVVFYDIPNKKNAEKKTNELKNTVVKSKPSETVISQSRNDDEGELIAVLTAAVAACMNTSVSNVNIRSFRRLNRQSSQWGTASRIEQLDNTF